MQRLLSCGFAGVVVLLLAAGDGKTKDAADAAAEDRTVRKAFQDDWKVVSVAVKQPLKKGQTLPSLSDVLKFRGVTLPDAIPPWALRLVWPVGPDILVRGLTTDKRPGHIDTFSIIRVDLDWLTDSALSEEGAIKFVFRTVLCREPTEEEQTRLLTYFESIANDRRERFEVLYGVVRQMNAAATAGIYEFKGDQLVVCLAAPGKPRPKNFGTGKNGGRILMTFERTLSDKASNDKW
jgi:hypothetical protein